MKTVTPNEKNKHPIPVPGIYNYCNRWCERCRFTDRCTVYAEEQEAKNQNNALAGGNPAAVFEHLAETLEKTYKILREEIEKQGFNTDTSEEDVVYTRKSISPELEQKAIKLSRELAKWKALQEESIKQKTRTLASRHKAKAASLTDAAEIIQHYVFFISVKTKRALMQTTFSDEFETQEKNGSAKVALLGFRCLIDAMRTLIEFFPKEEDKILTFLIRLSKIKKELETLFPKAYDFVRPGFDETN